MSCIEIRSEKGRNKDERTHRTETRHIEQDAVTGRRHLRGKMSLTDVAIRDGGMKSFVLQRYVCSRTKAKHRDVP